MSLLSSFASTSLLKNAFTAPIVSLARHISGCDQSIFGVKHKFRIALSGKTRRRKGISAKRPGVFGPKAFQDKPIQEWDDWDGFGHYRYRHHDYPNNWTLRDVQRRRILSLNAEERLRINAIRKADVLPTELSRLANEEIHKLPRDSAITRINRRCTITGRARGIFHQFRVSRFVFRSEADYNKVSGAERAKWIRGIDIKP